MAGCMVSVGMVPDEPTVESDVGMDSWTEALERYCPTELPPAPAVTLNGGPLPRMAALASDHTADGMTLDDYCALSEVTVRSARRKSKMSRPQKSNGASKFHKPGAARRMRDVARSFKVCGRLQPRTFGRGRAWATV